MILKYICIYVYVICLCVYVIVHLIPLYLVSLLLLFLPPSGMLFASSSTYQNPTHISKLSKNSTFSKKTPQILQISFPRVPTAPYLHIL